jgi:YbbR domain-containing protein
MIALIRSLVKYLPSLGLAVVLAVAVWISAVTAADPIVERQYDRAVPIEIVGQDPNLVLTSQIPEENNIKLSAPQSIWDLMQAEASPVTAVADLSGLSAGVHDVPVQIHVRMRPMQVISSAPESISVTLEPLETKTFPIELVQRGEPAVGFIAEAPVMSENTATVSGAKSQVDRVAKVRAQLDTNEVRENISRTIAVQAVDLGGQVVDTITLSPENVTVEQSVTNRGGYRNVVVKVATTGLISSGYRLTNISVSPPAVTIFSTNPQIINDLPGYVETASLDLTGARDDLDVRLPLELPPGVSVVGDQTVSVQVGIAAIESSLTLSAMRVEVIGLGPGQAARFSPETVDVILSGPLPLLDSLSKDDVTVIVEMEGEDFGTYQRTPRVELKIAELRVESILPGTVEITVIRAPLPTATPRPN